MSAYTIIALIILVATGGLIAWLGDIIGYRLGKRRSSLFGLRPRTTARVVGIAVGATLPLIGLAVAALGSSYVRDAAFRLQYLRDQEVHLTDQVRFLNEQTSQAQAAAETARVGAEEAKRDASRLQEQAIVLGEQIAQLEHERRDLQAKARQASANLKEAEANLHQSEQELKELQTQHEELQQQRDKLQNVDIPALEASVATAESSLAATQLQLKRVEEDVRQATNAADKAQEELAGRERRIAEKEAEIAEKQEQLEDLETALAAWEHAAYGPVLYESGHELVRDLIRSDQTLEQIRSSLVEDVVLSSKIAHASGVVVEEGRSVRVYFAILPESQPAAVGEDQIISGAASAIHGGQEDSYVLSIQTVARVFAVRPEPEPAPVMLMVIPNSRVYAPGDTIVSVQIDGGRPRDQVFGDVWAILSLLRGEAQERGVLAHPETGQYGDVPAEQLLAALDQLLAAGELQTVRAIAAEDVYRAGLSPFLVAIQVGEESES